MIQRLVRDESGMTMGLTVIMIVLIGVMGAGLLTFVQNDLSSVIDSNQGQTALNLADGGTQAAERHLLVDANVRNYDGDNTTGTAPGGESPWSCVHDASNVCTAGSGKLIDLDAGAGTSTRVWIKYLRPSTQTSHLAHPDHAPEMVPTGSDYEFGRDFFKVISEGRAGNARRKVEAIYQTYDLGTPRAYFAKGNITFSGNSTVENISLFSMKSIISNGNVTMLGPDLAYDDWYSTPFNTTARTLAPTCSATLPDGTTATRKCAGVGAVETVGRSIFQENRDFDRTTNPQFITKPTPDATLDDTTKITFPFNYQREPDIAMMRQAARMQGNYYRVGSSSNLKLEAAWEAGASVPKWAANSDISTIVFVEFTDGLNTSNKLLWDVDNAGTPGARCVDRTPVFGTLVVVNGKFETQQNKAPLKGTIVVNGALPGTDVYTDTGGGCMQSFVRASGDIKLAGNITGFTLERGNRPGFFGVRLFSWRECYSATCT